MRARPQALVELDSRRIGGESMADVLERLLAETRRVPQQPEAAQ